MKWCKLTCLNELVYVVYKYTSAVHFSVGLFNQNTYLFIKQKREKESKEGDVTLVLVYQTNGESKFNE